MMERRLLVGMAGIVLAVLSAFAIQVGTDTRTVWQAVYGGRR